MSEVLGAPRFARKVVALISRRPALTLAVTTLLYLLIVVPGFARLTFDFTYRSYFYDDDPLIVRFDAFEREFGNDDTLVVAVETPSDVFDAESAKLIHDLTRRLDEIPGVVRVDSITNFNWVHAAGDEITIEPLIPENFTPELLAERKKVALAHPSIPNYLISRDAKTALIFARVEPGIVVPPDDAALTLAARAAIAEFSREDYRFHLTGGPPLNHAFLEAAVIDMERLIPIVLLITLALLAALIRRVVGVLLALLVIGTTAAGAMGIAGVFGLPINNLSAVTPQLLIAVSTAESIHIIISFYAAQSRGLMRDEAANYALTVNVIPTILTNVTTSIGFFSFATSTLKALAVLGIVAGIGTTISWFLTYCMLGPLLYLIPQGVKPERSRTYALLDRWAPRMIDLYLARRRAIYVVFTVLTVAAIYGSFQNTVNSDPFKYFRAGYPLRVANEFVEEKVGGARSIELVIDSGSPEGIHDPAFLRKVEALETWIESRPRVTQTVSIVDILKQTNQALNGDDKREYKLPDARDTIAQELLLYSMSLPEGADISDRMSDKRDRLRLTVYWTVPTSAECLEEIDRILEHSKELGLAVMPTGKYHLWQNMNPTVVRSFLVSIWSASLPIFFLLVFAFRSFKLGFIAMIPNVIPMIFGGAALYMLGSPFDIGTVAVISVCLGIAVDDTIHVLANYHRLQSAGVGSRDALVEIFRKTTPALMVSTAVLVASFGTFAFSTFTPNYYFGVMSAIILTAALITDLTLTPAILLRDAEKER